MPPTIEPTLAPAKNETCPWYQPLCNVTPVSKYLAMVIFILMPFVGGYIGYRLAPEKVVEVPVVQVTPSSAVVQAPSSPAEEKPEDVPAVTSQTLRYINPTDWREYVADEHSFTSINTIDNIQFDQGGESDVISFAETQPFFQLVASTSDYMIFCFPPFGKGGMCSGLIKYSPETHHVKEMANSDLYNPYGGVLSTDHRSFIVISSTTEIGRINFDADMYTKIETLTTPNKFFAACAGGPSCDSDMELLDAHNLKVKVFTFVKCDVDDYCMEKKPQSEDYITIQI